MVNGKFAMSSCSNQQRSVQSLTDSELLEEINKRREGISAFKLENHLKSKELEQAKAQLKSLRTKQTPEVKKAEKLVKIFKEKLRAAEEKAEKRDRIKKAQKHFLDRLGAEVGFNDEDKNKKQVSEGSENVGEEEAAVIKTLVFRGIRENGLGCKLIFSLLEQPDFHVTAAIPHFEEFDELAAEVNATKNFAFLVVKAREYFIKHERNLKTSP